MEGRHYEDDGTLNAVLIGNQLLLACTAAPHAWVVDVKPAQDASDADKSKLAEAMRAGALRDMVTDETELMRSLE
jgi:hypothetical protein